MKLIGFLFLFSFFLLISCANPHQVTGGSGPTASATQSETAATLSNFNGISRIVVSYNDETADANLISYSQTGRVISSGATSMGWSYSDDGGTTWTYGGALSPPRGWAVLWGDPAITTFGAAYNVVFLSNLAMPTSKFPAGGVSGYVYYGDGRESYLGGACIAKSTDGGKTFANYQCLSNTQPVEGVPDSAQGHFYDGGSMASSSAGEVFAAYVDIVTGLIDVYRSPHANGSFQPLATPFPNATAISHARLKIGPDDSLYVATDLLGTDGSVHVYLNRFANGSWGTPVLASDPSVQYPNIDFGTSLQGSELTLRAGPQFGFDVGAASAGGNDAVRMLYVRQDQNNHLYLSASSCPANLSGCYEVPGWGFQGGGPGGSAVDTYNPQVTAWKGFIGLPPTWQATWAYHYGKAGSINVSRATLGYVNGNALIFPIDIIQNAPVCSDTRGYWGDYDAMLQTGWKGQSSLWMRFATDSSSGCTKRWQYFAQSQHVQQANYSY